ncbi:MAG: exodeoxyribonuclease III [Actinomycetaceae bacterium]|nr:exodeoxyribonuclease III [Actinomycetaceae bacterium]
MAFSLATINVNGIRAAIRRDMAKYLQQTRPDVLALQEVRASDAITNDLLGDDWELVNFPCEIKGRAGVTVAVRRDSEVKLVPGSARFGAQNEDEQAVDVDTGRWLEVTVDSGGDLTRVVSAYLHSGQVGTEKMDQKYAHLDIVTERMAQLAADSTPTVVCGDLNIVHTESDIKNWKGNHNKTAGVLDEEIAYVDGWLASGWVDVVRELAGAVQGPYSWWSWRGKAFDNDAGWRIDYHLATASLAQRALSYDIGRAPAYDQRFSDHAPVLVNYQ